MRGDSVGRTANRGAIVSPGTCNVLVTPSIEQFPNQTQKHGKSRIPRPRQVVPVRKIGTRVSTMCTRAERECTVCVHPAAKWPPALAKNNLAADERRNTDKKTNAFLIRWAQPGPAAPNAFLIRWARPVPVGAVVIVGFWAPQSRFLSELVPLHGRYLQGHFRLTSGLHS